MGLRSRQTKKMNVNELDRFCIKARKLSNKKELYHSKQPYVSLLYIAEESIKKNRRLIQLIEQELLHELPAAVRTEAVRTLNDIDGLGSKEAD